MKWKNRGKNTKITGKKTKTSTAKKKGRETNK